MKLLTKAIEAKLIKNYAENELRHRHDHEGTDFKPVLKLFGGGACTWLITEYNPDTGLFFGLCDLGAGYPELGYIDREEIEGLRFPPYGLPVERDRFFKADKTLSAYTKDARTKGYIDA